ncbi:copper transport outer membrane protein MctB [Murinocardiopsis flavida]|uniref:Copper transport outer membrane protein MctB n=1 Tax=Murinocardiopsis flavida TaxID=645275 RepID=A0A2P8D3I3_9ACTN|nr:copper transporter [Murinocardiopsis flavida]PSK91781.1 copper transport outer membrane protein MctB [Murinocardiopsis flavida]
MVDFRYHLVSIVAVFLALAVGVALGATVLGTPLLHTLRAEDTPVPAEPAAADRDGDLARRLHKGGEGVVDAYAAEMLAGRLDGAKVVVVEAPNADPAQRKDATARIEQAGGTVAGRLLLAGKFTDPEEASFVGGLADRVAPEDSRAEGGPYEKAGTQLAKALLVPAPDSAEAEEESAAPGSKGAESEGSARASGDGGAAEGPRADEGDEGAETGSSAQEPDGGDGAAEPSAEAGAESGASPGAPAPLPEVAPRPGAPAGGSGAAAVLAAYSDAGLVTGRAPEGKADVALVIGPADPLPTADGNASVLALTRAMSTRSGGAVLAGDTASAGPGGLVAQARAGETGFSTVDTLGTVSGGVVGVLALADALERRSGHYGVADGATRPLPDPVPGPRDTEGDEVRPEPD